MLSKNLKISFLVLFVFIVSQAFLLPLSKSKAHPHVFITQRLTAVFDDNGLAGIKVHWLFDDMFASMIAESHDTNRNGQLEPDEVQVVKEKAFSYISEDNYFVFIKIDNKPFEVKFIKDFNAILNDKSIVYEFFIPCHVAATEDSKKVSISTYDPTYYTSIFFAKDNPVSLKSADNYELKANIKKDPRTKIYFDMVHPWTLFLEFRRKQ